MLCHIALEYFNLTFVAIMSCKHLSEFLQKMKNGDLFVNY